MSFATTFTVRRLGVDDWPAAYAMHQLQFTAPAVPGDSSAWFGAIDKDLSFIAVSSNGSIIGLQCALTGTLGPLSKDSPASSAAVAIGCFSAVDAGNRGGPVYAALCHNTDKRLIERGIGLAFFNAGSPELFHRSGGRPAGLAADIELTARAAAAFKTDRLHMRLSTSDTAAPECYRLYCSALSGDLTMLQMPWSWWEAHYATSLTSLPFVLAVSLADGQESYVRFAVEQSWSAGESRNRALAGELVGTTRAAREAALFALASLEHIESVYLEKCSVDDALHWVRSGRRAIRVNRIYDNVWGKTIGEKSSPLHLSSVFDAIDDLYCPFII